MLQPRHLAESNPEPARRWWPQRSTRNKVLGTLAAGASVWLASEAYQHMAEGGDKALIVGSGALLGACAAGLASFDRYYAVTCDRLLQSNNWGVDIFSDPADFGIHRLINPVNQQAQ